jgi:hypothetical protein
MLPRIRGVIKHHVKNGCIYLKFINKSY